MLDDGIPRSIFLLIAMLLLGGCFAGSETAFSYCNKIRIKTLAESGDRRAKYAEKVLDNFDRALVTVLIGINVIYTSSSAIATVIAVNMIGGKGSVIATAIMTITIFIFCETIPKSIARANCDKIVLYAARPLSYLIFILTPISFIFSKMSDFLKSKLKIEEEPSMTEDEFQEIVSTVGDEGILEPEEEQIIQSAIEFGDMIAKDVMLPADKIFALEMSTDPEIAKERLIEERYSRIPVYRGTIDNIVGILDSNEILFKLMNNPYTNLREGLRNAYFIAPDMSLNSVFEEMSRRHTHISIVKENGKTIGLVTMEDILEEIVGEIYDEDDVENRTVPEKEGAVNA